MSGQSTGSTIHDLVRCRAESPRAARARPLALPFRRRERETAARERLVPSRSPSASFADLAQEPPSALRERFPAEARERLRGTEALGRAAEQEEAAEPAHFRERNAFRRASSSAVDGGGSESRGSSRSALRGWRARPSGCRARALRQAEVEEAEVALAIVSNRRLNESSPDSMRAVETTAKPCFCGTVSRPRNRTGPGRRC